ncbi:MAG: pectin acetylesterase-family hydrolase [Desulfomonilia bacterium]
MRYRKFINAGLLILVSLLIASVTIAGAATPKPLVPNLPSGWSQVYPDSSFTYLGLSPACSNCPGTNPTYSFFVKKGTVNKVVIFFNGGGACWDPVNCLKYLTYNPMVFEFVSSGQLYVYNQPDPTSSPQVNHGIFDFNNPNNPFKDWYVVYLPYCTGDLFWGAADHQYTTPPYLPPQITATIKHRGFVNFQAVLKWVKDNFRLPEEIFVSGSSAGGYGAIMEYPFIRDSFPLTRVYVLGDAANGITGDDFNTKASTVWNAQFATWILGNDITKLTIEDIYTNIAAEYPLMKFAQYTTAYDGTQSYFYNLQLIDPSNGVPYVEEPWLWSTFPTLFNVGAWNYQMLLYAQGTAATAHNYRYYIGQGSVHTILTTDKFYSESSAGGVIFYQWVKSMVDNPFGVFGGPLQGIWQNLENDNP